MESHVTNLYKLCRVCGGKVITKYGFINAKTCNDYADLLTVGILPLRFKGSLKPWFCSKKFTFKVTRIKEILSI